MPALRPVVLTRQRLGEREAMLLALVAAVVVQTMLLLGLALVKQEVFAELAT